MSKLDPMISLITRPFRIRDSRRPEGNRAPEVTLEDVLQFACETHKGRTADAIRRNPGLLDVLDNDQDLARAYDDEIARLESEYPMCPERANQIARRLFEHDPELDGSDSAVVHDSKD